MNSKQQISALEQEASRLARFGANLMDAHTCAIVLPRELVQRGPEASSRVAGDSLILCGSHSLSSEVIPEVRIPREGGLLGWVATHRRPIHVSPFEYDSAQLGIYSRAEELKSLIAVPIDCGAEGPAGVIMCDSKKSFAFSKLQGKLLEDLAAIIARMVSHLRATSTEQSSASLSSFIERGEALRSGLGADGVEVLRVQITNLPEVALTIGSRKAEELLLQFERLTRQTLPPHFPLARDVTGDLLLAIDNMMTGFFENRLGALAERLASRDVPQLRLAFLKASARGKLKRASIEDLLNATIPPIVTERHQGGVIREFRRA